MKDPILLSCSRRNEVACSNSIYSTWNHCSPLSRRLWANSFRNHEPTVQFLIAFHPGARRVDILRPPLRSSALKRAERSPPPSNLPIRNHRRRPDQPLQRTPWMIPSLTWNLSLREPWVRSPCKGAPVYCMVSLPFGTTPTQKHRGRSELGIAFEIMVGQGRLFGEGFRCDLCSLV